MCPTHQEAASGGPRYSLEQLADRADVPVRTIRYYIQRGLVPRPEGEKKGAYYTQAHLEQLLQVRKWVGAGMSLERVAALLQGEPALPRPAAAMVTAAALPPRRTLTVYTVAEGVELTIDTGRAALSAAAIEALLEQLRRAVLAQAIPFPSSED